MWYDALRHACAVVATLKRSLDGMENKEREAKRAMKERRQSTSMSAREATCCGSKGASKNFPSSGW